MPNCRYLHKRKGRGAWVLLCALLLSCGSEKNQDQLIAERKSQELTDKLIDNGYVNLIDRFQVLKISESKILEALGEKSCE